MEPVCPKCKGKLVRLPDGTYPMPTIKCMECGWFIEKAQVVVMPYSNVPSPTGLRGRTKVAAVLDETFKAPGTGYVEASHGRYIHLFKDAFHRNKNKNSRAFCGVLGRKVSDPGGASICQTCLRNYEKSKKVKVKEKKEGAPVSRSPILVGRKRAAAIHFTVFGKTNSIE